MLPYTLPTFAFVAGFAMAQTPQWRPVWPANPSPVSGSEIAYDHLRDRLLVFGGAVNHVPSALCITFDGTSWTGGGSGPPARLFHKLAFDARRGEILLVGGDAGFGSSIFTDTWVWSGGWVQRFPQTPPPAVTHGFSLTYDEDREVVVLYQGQSLYEWDGVNWLRRTPPGFPPWRTYHAAAYDSRQHRLLIHGGQAFTSSFPLGDTWAWDGVAWQQLPGSGPPLTYPQMAYDPERDVAVLVGGGSACYEFDGTTWTAASSSPGYAPMTWDRQRNRAVQVFVVSGQTSPLPGSMWVYEAPGLAIAQPYGVGCGSPALVAREDPNARPLLGGTLGIDVENAPTGAAFMCFGWSSDLALGLALPRRMDAWGLPGCWLLQSDDAITLPCATTGATTARFTFALPSAPTFAGLSFFLQPWAPAPGVNPAGAAIGNAIAVTIGSF